ncbi:hypothetical protein DPMN_122898 [Dreissena polymorpha]|uniref:Uncharacterized protein n=1 Tax=Dreissena polymorpha TaxID=45954 RepID=A0A9D4GQI9_DREPO|nr:hypothetical protein DPMN_122898 [Dreissena polymorpha]
MDIMHVTNFHEDWKINVVSRDNCPPLGGHVFKETKIIFELIKDIIGTNLLTKFHEDQTINVPSSVLTRKMPRPMAAMMNLLTKFHEEQKINVASRVKNDLLPGSQVLQAKITIFKLIKNINRTNHLSKFHEDRKINMASRVFTRFYCSHIWKNAPPPGGQVFQPASIIFQDIIGMNVVTKFHQDQTINVPSRPYKKNSPPLDNHVFQAKVTIFELIQDIIGTNHLSKFHEDRKINVASRVLTRFYYSHIRKNAAPPGGLVCQPTGIIFELVQDITGMNLLTKKNALPPGGHVFQPTSIIFEHVQDIIGINLLTKFHEDQTINVASRLKNALPLGSHVFQANVTIFKLIQYIIETNFLTKFHEDWTINVAFRELTSQMLTPHTERRTTDKRRSQKLTMSTLCSGELKTHNLIAGN